MLGVGGTGSCLFPLVGFGIVVFEPAGCVTRTVKIRLQTKLPCSCPCLSLKALKAKK